MPMTIHRQEGTLDHVYVNLESFYEIQRQTNGYSFWEVPYEDMFYTVLKLVLLPEPVPL